MGRLPRRPSTSVLLKFGQSPQHCESALQRALNQRRKKQLKEYLHKGFGRLARRPSIFIHRYTLLRRLTVLGAFQGAQILHVYLLFSLPTHGSLAVLFSIHEGHAQFGRPGFRGSIVRCSMRKCFERRPCIQDRMDCKNDKQHCRWDLLATSLVTPLAWALPCSATPARQASGRCWCSSEDNLALHRETSYNVAAPTKRYHSIAGCRAMYV